MIREEESRMFPSPGKAIVKLMACHKILPEGQRQALLSCKFCALWEESVVEKKKCIFNVDIRYDEHL